MKGLWAWAQGPQVWPQRQPEPQSLLACCGWEQVPPRCSQCQGPIRPGAWGTGKGHLSEQRPGWLWCCSPCAHRAVQVADVPRLHATVASFLQQHLHLRMADWLGAHQVHLVGPQGWAMPCRLTGHPATARKLGEARTQVRRQPHRLVHAEVRVLRGLPFVSAAAVLVHEAFHVYSASQGLGLSRVQEEGTANLWAYLMLTVMPGNPLAEQERLRLLHDDDAVYGQGFRDARVLYKQVGGFGAYMRAVA